METFTIIDSSRPGEPLRAAIVPGLTLAQHLFMHGAFEGRALCSGAGRCGLCAANFPESPPAPLPGEEEVLAPGSLSRGVRLACRRRPEPGMAVRVRLSRPAAPTALPGTCEDGGRSWLGIDLGTTSIQWRALAGGREFSGSLPNPQLPAGSEVMSRLAMAAHPEGAAALRRAVSGAVRGILSGLPCLPDSVCLAANPAMTCLALGLDASGLMAAPYRLDWPGGADAALDEGLPRAYIPPLPAPFVGGDVSAGLAAVAFGADRSDPPYLLADLGTNGEFALVLPDGRVLVASVPMGPALEGMGMAMGMAAGPGAAVSFRATPAGLAAAGFDGAGRPLGGISGTGYLSLLALLRSIGAMDEAGRFVPGPSPMASRVLAGLSREGSEPCLAVDGLRLHASDVEALLKVKAAFECAVRILLREAGLAHGDLKAVLLAGALGEHASPRDLEALGFFPPGGAARAVAVGNTSLAGACLAAQREDARRWLSELGERIRPVDVVRARDFQKLFVGAMRFSHAR